MPTTLHPDRRRGEQAAAPTTTAQRVDRGRTPSTGPDRWARVTVAAAVAVVLAAATIVAVLVFQLAPVDVSTGSRTAGAGAGDEDEALRRLIARGYVPPASAAVNPDSTVTGDLYTAEQRATLQQVRAGLLPDELLDSEPYVTNRLINQGLIPVGSAR